MNESRLSNTAGIRTTVIPTIQQKVHQQISNVLSSPSAIAPGFGRGGAYPTFSSKPLAAVSADARLSIRAPIALPQRPPSGIGVSGGACVLSGMGNPPGPPMSPFPMFSHQRDQLLRNNRPNTAAIASPFNFRPQFFGGNIMGAMHNNGASLNVNSTIPVCPGDYLDNLENTIFSEEVQEEANSYFQQIYSLTGRLSVYEFITKLKGLRDSMIPRDKELLMCVVKNLFDEYKFFQEYPDRELRTTAEVYGGLIREGIISNLQLATAVRKVVEAVQSDPSKPLWNFGVVALNSCRLVLYKYPKVCQMFLNSDSFSGFPAALKECVTNGSQGNLPSSRMNLRDSSLWNIQPQGGRQNAINGLSTSASVPVLSNHSDIKFASRGLVVSGASILNATNIDTLVSATEREGVALNQPINTILERVAFLCNNLSQINLPTKTDEMMEIISETNDDFLKWFAQYLVMKRVSIEQNFHTLYNNFLISIGNVRLDDFVEKETFRDINILLRSDKCQAVSNFGDRQLLKNLGHWLGLITIGRDKPILAKDLDLKLLLLDAFNKNQQELLYVLPFVVKTLLASSKSSIFGPRSAWVFGIIKVLVEIHNEPDLKLNLKFEIEVLCKSLNIELASVELDSYLKESSRLPKLDLMTQDDMISNPNQPIRLGNALLMPPTNCNSTSTSTTINSKEEKNAELSKENFSATLNRKAVDSASVTANSQKHLSQIQPPAIYHYNDINVFNAEGLMQHLKDLSHLPLFQYHPSLKNVCKAEIMHAIKELMGGIIERSINASITVTERVCCKDFVFDGDEEHLRRAAHQMMRAMTAGIAAITCREPLATTISDYLKQALYSNLNQEMSFTPEQTKMIDDAVFAITEANLEIATNFIVKSACEKAIIEIEKRLGLEFAVRRKARENGRVFFPVDSSVITMGEMLHENIRVKPEPVNESAIKIYDEFSTKICGFKPMKYEEFAANFLRNRNLVTANNNNLEFNNKCVDFSAESNDPQNLLLNGVPQFTERTLQPHLIVDGVDSEAAKNDAETIFKHEVEFIFREWLKIYYTSTSQRDSLHALASLIKLIQQHGVFETDEMITNFFRHCIYVCLQVTYRHLKIERQQMLVRQKCYYTLDGFAMMVCLMVKHSDGNSKQSSKLNLLRKVLGTLSSALHMDHEHRKQDFNGMAFQRILIIMFNELTVSDETNLEPINWNILEAFGHALFVLQPRREPGFAFHWLEIIGHRNFIGRLLSTENVNTSKIVAMYTQLIMCLLKFLAPFLCNIHLPKSIAYFYKGTLRVLLVILHDFPEIFCEYHYVLCNVIPPNCVQLRNLVLSAYPHEMSLPDPFTQRMEVIVNLPEMSKNPKMHREMSSIIPVSLRSRLDDYLTTRSTVDFLSDLPVLLQVSTIVGQKYNDNVMNALVIYVGIHAIESIQEHSERITMKTITHTAYMDIFQNLVVSFCTEGRYLLFNAIVNQLRYPNSHTHYFSNVLLYLFLETNTEIIREQITRILLERLVALRPHPWGLLTTFIELVSNRLYDFWQHDFVRCAPEIERLFASVASSCNLGQNYLPDEQQNLDNNNNQSTSFNEIPVE